jgi:arsenite-transporting ATPase
MAEEMTVLPGMDELGNLLWIGDHVDKAEYDLIVVDAAPTGETVRLLSLPEASRWWIEKIAPIGRLVQKLGGPVLRRIVGVPLPSDAVYEAAEQLPERCAMHDPLATPTAHRCGSYSTSKRCRSRRHSARSPTSTCTATRRT